MGDNSVILKSDNSGEIWKVINPGFPVNYKDFQFISDSIILAAGDNYRGTTASLLIKSADNGETWDSVTYFPGKQFYSIWFFNGDSGLVAGYDGIHRTVDSGLSWETSWGIVQSGYK
jgi:photosystem II stability/assembly factor-like uncharacterized protein